MIFVVVLFRELNNSSVISSLFKAVGYTYGPLLGAFHVWFDYKISGTGESIFLGYVCFHRWFLTWSIVTRNNFFSGINSVSRYSYLMDSFVILGCYLSGPSVIN